MLTKFEKFSNMFDIILNWLLNKKGTTSSVQVAHLWYAIQNWRDGLDLAIVLRTDIWGSYYFDFFSVTIYFYAVVEVFAGDCSFADVLVAIFHVFVLLHELWKEALSIFRDWVQV